MRCARAGSWIAGWLALSVFLVPLVPVATAAPAGVGLALTASPSTGAAPLSVTFNASLTPASTTGTFEWSFGDGASFVVTGTGFSSVTHLYSEVGRHQANVSFSSAGDQASASLIVSVVVATLSVFITATPVHGPAPLTVQFHATATGGTGTYTSILWTFGDGSRGSGTDVDYTYPTNGTYGASVNVTDTAGQSASASLSVDVQGAVAIPADSPGWSSLDETLAVVAISLVSAAIAFAIVRPIVVRRDRSAPRPVGALREPGAPEAVADPPVLSPEELEGPPASDPSPLASRRLSERILVHLYWFARPGSDLVARAEASQHGMADRLGATQTALSKALARLQAVGLVEVSLAHIPGFPRRVKCYRLTPAGEALARRVQASWRT